MPACGRRPLDQRAPVAPPNTLDAPYWPPAMLPAAKAALMRPSSPKAMLLNVSKGVFWGLPLQKQLVRALAAEGPVERVESSSDLD